MRKIIVLAGSFFFSVLQVLAQADPSTDPEPIGGVSRVALPFYKIDFSLEQRALLKGQQVELLFAIDTAGTAVLEDIKGISESAIRDSLYKASAGVPLFYPRQVNGAKEPSLYFLQFELPEYRQVRSLQPQLYPMQFVRHRYEDYEYIHKSGQRLDILIGGAGNAFLGKPADHLSPGGGLKMDIMYTGAKGYGAGLVMSMYGNSLRKPYPIYAHREHNNAPPTFMLGIGLNKLLQQKKRSELQAQLELNYAGQNIIPKEDEHDNNYVQLSGFSPGLVLHYLIKLGKDKTSFYYTQPSVLNHYLNLHGALRPLFLDLKEASGVMLEVGVSYRLTNHLVDEYRLKQ